MDHPHDVVALVEALCATAEIRGDPEFIRALSGCLARISTRGSGCPMRWALRRARPRTARGERGGPPAAGALGPLGRLDAVERLHALAFERARATLDTFAMRALLECEEFVRTDPACPLHRALRETSPVGP